MDEHIHRTILRAGEGKTSQLAEPDRQAALAQARDRLEQMEIRESERAFISHPEVDPDRQPTIREGFAELSREAAANREYQQREALQDRIADLEAEI